MDPRLGRLAEVAAWWAAGTDGHGAGGAPPRRPRLVRVGGDAGSDADRDAEVEALADAAGVGIRDVATPAGDVDTALSRGRAVTDEEVDGGADLLVVAERAPAGSPVDLAAAATVAAMTGREPTAVVGVAPGPDGRLDDEAWMARVPAVRDRLRRARPAGRDVTTLLRLLEAPDLAVLTGVLAQAAVRRTPVVLDATTSLAAALLAESLEPMARERWLAGTACPDPAAGHALDVLGLDPLVDLGVWTGRGTGALVAVTVLRAALAASAPLR